VVVKTTLAQHVGGFAANLRFSQLPPTALALAKLGVSDCIAVMVAGSREAAVQTLRKTLASLGGPAESTLYFGGERMPAPATAWINSTAGHVLDYDDVAFGHPSVVIVPAILAEGEALNASGADILTAYVAGYETWMELITRERDNYQMKGWHPTPLIGALAAAAACANLRRLDAKAATSALGLAAAQASGVTASYGTMAKAMQVGKAAYNGLISARMAASGMLAAADALDHERGFLRAISPAGRVDLERVPQLGVRWHSVEQGLGIKRYPMCYCAHRAIDAMLSLNAQQHIAPAEIEAIEVTLGKIQATTLKNHQPATGLDAIFSVEFGVAAALLAGNVGLKEVSDAFVARADVQALLRRVTVAANEDYDPEWPAMSRFDQVHVRLSSGETLTSEPVYRALGDAQRPLSAADLRAKFLDCFAAGQVNADAGAILNVLENFENADSCRALYRPALSAVTA
jgi:2-methylcitrate dehydratase PrpD